MAWDHTRRVLRRDLAGLDDATARCLRDEFRGYAQVVAAEFYNRAQQAFFPIDFDDLVDVGLAGVYEGWQAFNDRDPALEGPPTGAFGGGRAAYIRRVVRWRIADYVQGHMQEAPHVGTRRDAGNGVLRYQPSDEPNPDETLYRYELRFWLRSALARLPIRRRIIVTSVSKGDSYRQLAQELGIALGTVYNEYRAGIAALRAAAAKAQLGEHVPENASCER
jgi:RNA polymerase sigma factor (sigma-70 family)